MAVTSNFIPIHTGIPIELQNLGWASQVGQQVFSGWVDDQNDKHVQRRVKEIEKYGHLQNLDYLDLQNLGFKGMAKDWAGQGVSGALDKRR